MQGFINGDDLVLKAPEGTETVNAIVSPKLADKWLETQIKNRPVQRVSMLAYRTDMIAGRWSFTATPLCFDWDGHLIDGQNRLEALKEITIRNFMVPFAVARGLDPESQMFMDQGARRTAGQQLGLKGIASGTAIAAGVKLALVWERGQMLTDRWGMSNPVTHTEVIEWAQEHPEVVRACQHFLNRLRQIGLRPSSGLAFVVRVAPVLPEELELFITEMHTMANLRPGSPTLAFAKRLMRIRENSSMALSDTAQLAFLIRTWNAWVNGRSQTNFAQPPGGFNADNFPTVDGL